MSEIKTFVDNQKDLTIHKVSGDLTSQEILERLAYCFQHEPTSMILWDCSNASWAGIKRDELRDTVAGVKKYTKKGDKMALVFSRDVDFGIGRMFGAFAEMGGYDSEFGSFKKMEEADKWLGVRK